MPYKWSTHSAYMQQVDPLEYYMVRRIGQHCFITHMQWSTLLTVPLLTLFWFIASRCDTVKASTPTRNIGRCLLH